MTELHPAVESWLDYLAQRNRSAATLRTYRSTMVSFPADPLTVTLDQAEAWWQSQRDAAVNTRNRTLSCVRSFYAWALRFDLVDRDPTRRLDPPRKGHRLPQPTSRAELHAILARCDTEEAPDLRRAVCLAAFAGLRVGEAAALDWRDVDLEGRRIIVRGGKGDKDRAVGLSVLLTDELLPNSGGNVVTGTPLVYTAAALQRRVNRLLDRAGAEGTFHKLRARFATVTLAGTGNLLAVSRALGHSSPAVTAVYAATADSDLDLIAEAAVR